MKVSGFARLLAIFVILTSSHIHGRSYNRYHSEEGSVKDSLSSTKFGKFQVFWDASDPYFYVIHTEEPDKILFQTLPSQSFITVGYATDSNPPIVDGNFKANEWVLFETGYQSIDKVVVEANGFSLHGEVWGLVTKATYVMRFSVANEEGSSKELSSQLAFDINVMPVQGTFNRVFLNYWSDENEKFYGFGSQFTHWNLNGRRVPILCAEQGIGRGAQPITSLLNLLGDRAGGDWSTTYAPKPLYITNHNRSVIFENTEMMFFDLRDNDAVVVEIWGSSLKGRILFGRNMLDLITEITAVTGRMKVLPQWTQEGAVAGLEGGTEEVTHLVDKLLQHEVPLAAVWIQDWVGLRKAFDGDRLKWNWQLDSQYYPNWNEMVKYWGEEHGIRVMSYINPFFSENDAGKVGPGQRNLYREGIVNGYFVQSPQGGSYKMHSGSIEFCMLDTTNPEARVWMKNVMKIDMIENSGSAGWMADFGEYLPFDAVLYGGQNAAEYHNIYPEEWARVNQEAVEESALEKKSHLKLKRQLTNGIHPPEIQNNRRSKGRKQIEDTHITADREVVTFMRSAGLKSPAHTALFWLGDQLVSWDKHDGLKSAIVGALSGGIGGHSITHSDIGGYTMQDKGPMPYIRTKELLLRWIEFSAFGSALFRSHVGSNTSPLNSQIYEDEDTMTHFAHFARIFAHLGEYRGVLMKEAETKGWPLIRQMAAHYAYDEVTWELTDQYMFGEDIMIAPVLAPVGSDSSSRASKDARNGGNKGAFPVASVKVYIPAHSKWIHLWTGQEVNAVEGRYVAVDAPIGYPPVFYLPGSAAGKKLREFVLKNGYGAKLHVVGIVAEGVAGVDKVASSSSSSSSSLSSSLSALSSLPLVASEGGLKGSSSSRILSSTAYETRNFTQPPRTHHATAHVDHSVDHSIGHVADRVVVGSSKYNKYNVDAVIGVISDYVAPDWAEWLGISQYVSAWNSSYYAMPLSIESDSSGDMDWVPSIHSASSILGDKGLGGLAPLIDVNSVNIGNVNGNSLKFQDIDVDLSSLFQS